MFDPGKTRGWKGAILFYLGFFVLFIVLGALGGAIGATVSGASSYAEGVRVGSMIGTVISTLLCPLLGAWILMRKKRLGNPVDWALVALAGLLSVVGGGALLGLIPIAFLTTRKTAAEAAPNETASTP